MSYCKLNVTNKVNNYKAWNEYTKNVHVLYAVLKIPWVRTVK